MVYVGGGVGLLLFRVVYRRRVAKVAEVAWFCGAGLLLWIMSNIYVSLYFVLPRVFVLGKVAEVAWFRGVKSPVIISVSSA